MKSKPHLGEVRSEKGWMVRRLQMFTNYEVPPYKSHILVYSERTVSKSDLSLYSG